MITASMSQEEKIGRLWRRLDPANSSRDRLSMDSISVESLTDRFGTPLYVYSGSLLRDHIRATREVLVGDVDVVYSVKANPSLGLCQLLASCDLGAEVASAGELVLALEAGFCPSRILFAGPGKTDEELFLAANKEIRAINVESVGEIERLSAFGAAMGRPIPIALRLNPRERVGGARMRMGGGSEQFGLPEEDLAEIVERLRHLSGVRCVGLHVYAGTQLIDAGEALSSCGKVIEIAVSLAGMLGRALDLVDLGGGLGVPYFSGMQELDLAAFGSGLSRLVREARGDSRLSRASFVLELGRYLVAECGLYVVRVVDVKTHRGRHFVVTDGGMHHHAMATGNFGQVFRKTFPIARVGLSKKEDEDDTWRPEELDEDGRDVEHSPRGSPSAAHPSGAATRSVESCVVGPCCTPLDVLAERVTLPVMRQGDLLGVFYSGAYGYSASSLAFLSHPTPAEVLVDVGSVHLLRERGGPKQVLYSQRPIRIDSRAKEMVG